MGRRKGVVDFDESPPDDFDPANPYKDPVAMLEMREHIVREKWIDIEKAKIIREKLVGATASKASTTSRSAATSSTSTSSRLAASVGARTIVLMSSMVPRWRLLRPTDPYFFEMKARFQASTVD
ncbi:hypothetical protein GBA52_017841 [Prunus armeniaca]|nr:hypothetical protein GBA52_017841 [Prunus armeniaca]